jgi:hypothetical protein
LADIGGSAGGFVEVVGVQIAHDEQMSRVRRNEAEDRKNPPQERKDCIMHPRPTQNIIIPLASPA